jgi:hypothetical protein
MAACVKIMVLLDVMNCGLIGRLWCFIGIWCHHVQVIGSRGSRFLQNVGTCLPHYTISHPKRLYQCVSNVMSDILLL